MRLRVIVGGGDAGGRNSLRIKLKRNIIFVILCGETWRRIVDHGDEVESSNVQSAFSRLAACLDLPAMRSLSSYLNGRKEIKATLIEKREKVRPPSGQRAERALR